MAKNRSKPTELIFTPVSDVNIPYEKTVKGFTVEWNILSDGVEIFPECVKLIFGDMVFLCDNYLKRKFTYNGIVYGGMKIGIFVDSGDISVSKWIETKTAYPSYYGLISEPELTDDNIGYLCVDRFTELGYEKHFGFDCGSDGSYFTMTFPKCVVDENTRVRIYVNKCEGDFNVSEIMGMVVYTTKEKYTGDTEFDILIDNNE